jgi:hypothetical protein
MGGLAIGHRPIERCADHIALVVPSLFTQTISAVCKRQRSRFFLSSPNETLFPSALTQTISAVGRRQRSRYSDDRHSDPAPSNRSAIFERAADQIGDENQDQSRLFDA